ncbi:GapA-binding peptide SR1P [Gracilibacillus sp. YIM 98692]|uniref:GapA-binding peptide SR1P n=1 Tax=Gracilibacillus sp. YIM 98692 TaxID=2663532 RepID=UPI0013D8681F|nr:GapA-binding peptide SR1P [Gracilibacillus sp. YIM 98692]
MENYKGLPDRGVVVCAYFESVVETFPSSKVTTLYAICSPNGIEQENERNENIEGA